MKFRILKVSNGVGEMTQHWQVHSNEISGVVFPHPCWGRSQPLVVPDAGESDTLFRPPGGV